MLVIKKCVIIKISIVAFLFVSCQSNGEREAKQIVNDWVGKEIQISNQSYFTINGRMTRSPEIMDRKYKILLYVDTAGCTNCRLKLYDWKSLIEEVDSFAPEKVGFIFLIYPKNKKEILKLFRYYDINYPLFIDSLDINNRLNHFPKNPAYQCFLLNEKNKVLAIGNPVENPEVWELFRSIIINKPSEHKSQQTNVTYSTNTIDLGNVEVNKSLIRFFYLKNSGNAPLIIQQVISTCGCTKIEFDKKPMGPEKVTSLKVTIRPVVSGFFRKTLTVYCNTSDNPHQLFIKGVAY